MKSNMHTTFIDRPGQYITRNGTTVRIDVIVDTNEDILMHGFPCKGHIHRVSPKTGKVRLVYSIWRQNGCYRAIPGSGLDIVGYVGA